jgi:hypothetical protein
MTVAVRVPATLTAGSEGKEGDPRPVEKAAKLAEETGGLGRLGRPMDRRSPLFIGMAGAAGVAITIALVELVIRARSVLELIGLALFIAAGLDPLVSWLTRRWVPRSAAVVIVLLALVGAAGGFIAAAIPPLAAQTTKLISELPHYTQALQNHNSELGRLNAKYHIQQHLSHLLATRGSSLVGGVLGAGALVLGTLTSTLVVIVLVVYFLASMFQIKQFVYRLAPGSRRLRVILLGDEIFTKVGGFVLGNVATSVIAGLGTYLWMLAFGIPYPVLLALFVGRHGPTRSGPGARHPWPSRRPRRGGPCGFGWAQRQLLPGQVVVPADAQRGQDDQSDEDDGDPGARGELGDALDDEHDA